VLVRRAVDAVRLHGAVIVDEDVTVLPGDLRQVLLDDLPRAPADHGHLLLADLEGAQNQIAGHYGDPIALRHVCRVAAQSQVEAGDLLAARLARVHDVDLVAAGMHPPRSRLLRGPARAPLGEAEEDRP